MGLNAFVYINKSNLADELQDSLFLTDDETGELYPTPNDDRTYPAEMFTAAHKRLGNASLIGGLANAVSAIVGLDSVLMSKVLSSGSHSGDVVTLKDVERLESEINLVRQKTDSFRSADLEKFLNSLLELIEAAKKQGNPIVFDQNGLRRLQGA